MFDGYIRDWVHWTPRAAALVTPAGAIPYARLDADVDRIAAHLLTLGLAPQGDAAVAIDLPAPDLHLSTLAALARLGLASAPAGDKAAAHTLTEAQVPRDVPATEPRPQLQLELDPEAPGRISLTAGGRAALTWRELEIANFAHLRTLAAGRTGAFLPLTGVDTPEGFALVLCAWSCGGAVGAGYALSDVPAALENLPAGVAVLAPAQLAAVLEALPAGFRPQPGWRLAVTLREAPLPPALAGDAIARLTPDVRILYGTARRPLAALGHAADEALVPLSGIPLDVAPSGELRIDGLPTGDRGRFTPDGRLVLDS